MYVSITRQSVDARVQEAVGNLRVGRSVEDDAGLELKGEWPDPVAKARQLAAAANALGGEPLVYAIGVNDKTGVVTTPERKEVQDWYAQLVKQFDQIPPELLWSQTVYVGDDAESVQVLVFDTSEFPYVVKAPNERLEVPYRRATATRSARRSDLIRMLSSRTKIPPIKVAEARLNMWASSTSGSSELRFGGSLQMQVFVEQSVGEVATLPVREMRARLIVDELRVPVQVEVKELGQSDDDYFRIRRRGDPYPPEPVPPALGVYARDGIVVATAPGEFRIRGELSFALAEPLESAQALLRSREIFEGLDEVRADVALRVVGVEKVIHLSAALRRIEHGETGGEWAYEPAAEDPWLADQTQ